MGFYDSYNDLPTSGDYAWAEARANAVPAGTERVGRGKLTTEEHIVVLHGQVSFLAQIVYDLLTGQEDVVSNEQLTMVQRIKDYVKE